jgi:PAS domain S-box-containing protein
MNVRPEPVPPGAEDCLAGRSVMASLMRSMEWSNTLLGPVASWSSTLRMMVRLVLANRQQMFLWWGPQFSQIYNDPAWPALGAKHPLSLGQPASECWSEIWHTIGPLIETPFSGGEATWMDDVLLEIDRKGFIEETHWTIACSPVPDDSVPGGIGGVIGTVNEITNKVIAGRRVSLLRDLGARSSEAKTAEEACAIAAEALGHHGEDVPFVMVYLLDERGRRARLAAAAGVATGPLEGNHEIDLGARTDRSQPWPLADVVRTEAMQTVEHLPSTLANVPPGPWSDPPRSAVVCPIQSTVAHQLAGLLVLGVSSRLVLDDPYRAFFAAVSSQVAAAIANARAYDAERQRAEALAEIDRAKTAFFSNVSHEFRTPLTLLLGPLEDMLSRATGTVTIERDELRLVHHNSLRVLKLVNTLLDFSRIEAGGAQASCEPVDLSALTADLASVFRSAIERGGLRLSIDCPEVGEPVNIDRSMWEKIVLNLLSNAFKFTLEGEIQVSLRRDDRCVELSVLDTGTGISEDELPHVFERFHRIKGARGRTHEGSGIGLALVQELARLHGGSVRAESVYGHGSRFSVTIPLGPTPGPPADARPAQASTILGANAYVQEAWRWLPDAAAKPEQRLHHGETRSDPLPRILFADDNADLRQYVRRLLADSYEVQVVANGEAALSATRENPPDLVVTDLMMPQLDGLALLQKLRADSRTANVPVILLSARAGEEARMEGLGAGANDYLVKPFSARELLARVSASLETSRVAGAALAREKSLRKLAEDAETRTKEELAAELSAMTRLHELSTRLLAESELQPMLEEVLDASIALLSADFGNIQLYDENTGRLRIAAHRGFTQEFLDYFAGVPEGTAACGEALHRKDRVIVEDVLTEPMFEPHLGVVAAAGYRAVQSTPLLGRRGEVLGMISTHFRKPHRPSERDLRFMDLYAGQAVELIERKRAEEALRRSETQLAQAQRLSHTGSWTLNIATRRIYWSDEHFRIVGLDPKSPRPNVSSAIDVVHPDDRVFVQYALEKATRERAHFECDCRIVRPDGTVRDIHSAGQPVFNHVGELTDYIGAIVDVTERKQAHEKLRDSERRFRLLVESIPHHVWSFRPDGSMGYWNQRLSDYTGLTPDELRRGAWEALHPDDIGRVKAAWQAAFAQGTDYELEERVRGRDGRYRHFVCRAVPIRDGQGRPVEWFGTDTDVEDRHSAEDALHKLQAELAHVARVTTLGELAASIAHEVNQPLAAIVTDGYACMRWLGVRPPNLPEAIHAVERTVRDANRAADVIRRIRTFLKRDPGRAASTDLRDIVSEVIAMVQSETRTQNVLLSVRSAAQLPPAIADRIQLQQVVLNLVMNAIEAMSAVTDRSRTVEIELEMHSDDTLRLGVRDSGIGVLPEQADRIFDAFHTTKRQGMGMGLAISRSIVEAHGGRLWTTPNDGPGATFQFTLPVASLPALR